MSDLPQDHEAYQRWPGLTAGGTPVNAVRIVTGSRLHFGLIDTVEPYGGVGVMIDRPVTEVVVTQASQYQYHGPQPHRALEIAERIARLSSLADLPGCRIDVRAAAHIRALEAERNYRWRLPKRSHAARVWC